ncbi:MAG: hypothetical protein P1P64_00700 [Treponemataceae bacterium]
MNGISELEQKILRAAYPNLSFSDDLDIERYFELRRAGRLDQALSIYNNVLRQRYPKDEMRVQLLAFYRTKDARFYVLLNESLRFLAQNTIIKIKQIIIYITDVMDMVNINDPFSLIQRVERLASQISSDRFVVIAETERYTRFAEILDFRFEEMQRASEIIRMYVTNTIASVTDYRNEQARLKQKQLEQEKKRSLVPAFDFSKIVFSKEQIEQIVLPSENIRVEDKVIAYIVKYWDKAFDRGFENMLLLYSRKYKTKHYEIFNTIKIARMRNWQDAEILQSVLANVVSGYYYSITGDIYLNRLWQRVKPALFSGNKIAWAPQKEQVLISNNQTPELKRNATIIKTSNMENLPEKKTKKETRLDKTQITRTQSPRPSRLKKVYPKYKIAENTSTYRPTKPRLLISPEELKQEQKKIAEKYALMKAEEAKYFSKTRNMFRENAKRLAENEKAFLARQRLEAKKVQSENVSRSSHYSKPKLKTSKTKTSKSTTKPTTRSRVKSDKPTSSTRQEQKTTKTTRKTNFFVPRKTNNFDPSKNNSIEHLLKKETGKNYVVYKELFFKTVRTSIRHVLSVTSMNKQSLFKTEQNTAENVIYVFLERNYNNLYQSWENSNARETVYQLGFNVQNIEQIIKHWAKEVLKK